MRGEGGPPKALGMLIVCFSEIILLAKAYAYSRGALARLSPSAQSCVYRRWSALRSQKAVGQNCLEAVGLIIISTFFSGTGYNKIMFCFESKKKYI